MTCLALPLAQPHPAVEGHFPGSPVLPGAVLLDEALHAIDSAEGSDGRLWRIGSVKFLAAVADGATLVLDYEHTASGAVRFTIRAGGRPVATGILSARD